MVPDVTKRSIARGAATLDGLRLLVLFGSRARGDEGASSDWDFGYVGAESLDPDRLLAGLVDAVGSDRLDLVDLTRAGAQLRFRAARDGAPLVDVNGHEFARFWFDAVSFWCDMQPVLRAGYDHVLSQLGP